MARIHFIVKETAKMRYQDQARREGKSLGEWFREAAEEKLASSRPRSCSQSRSFVNSPQSAMRCIRRVNGRPDWEEIKRILVETRYPNLERLDSLYPAFDPQEHMIFVETRTSSSYFVGHDHPHRDEARAFSWTGASGA